MALNPGTRLGPYEILAPAGAGGMGEVYRARDVRLNREVAVKILASAAAASPQALERFEREARAIASLSHPGICPLYDVGTEPLPFLVMELLDGETLHQRIQRGPFDIAALIETGLALADALAAAHARRVIHRDLKPANVVITAHGPKIVDFGLARITEAITIADSGATAYPTRAAATPLTDAGTAVGTIAYMSPEQLRGEDLDARTDLFSLGLVLYEMATGRRAFEGATNAVTSAAILHEQPTPPRHRRPDVPPRLNETILNLLEKDRDVRTQTAAEVRAELMRLKRESLAARTAEPTLATRPALVSGALLALLLLVGAAAYFQTRPDPASAARPVRTRSFTDPRQLTTSGAADLPAVSPNGDYVVFVEHGAGGDSLWLRQVATETPRPILAPEPGIHLRGATITPDNTYVNYVRREGAGPLELWQVPLIGGPTHRLLRGGAVSFSPAGDEMVFTREIESGAELVIASSDGTTERPLTSRTDGKRDFWFEGPNNSIAPAWSPDGKTIAVLGAARNQGGEVVLVDVASGQERRVLKHGPPLIGYGLAWLDDDTLIGSMVDHPTAPMQLWLASLSTGTFQHLTNDVNQYNGVSVTQNRDVAVTARAESSFVVVTSDATAKNWSETVPVRPMKGSLGFGLRWLGNDLAFVSSSSSGFGLFRWHADKRPQELLAQRAGNVSASRDGSTVLFFDYEHNQFVSLGPAGRTRLAADSMAGVPVDGAQLLPDGRRFVSVALPNDRSKRRTNEVIIGTVASPNQISVVTSDRVRSTRGTGGRAEVSPNGLLIAYPSFDDQQGPVIAICDLASCSQRRTFPARTQWRWMPDSRALIYVDEGTLSDLWVQRLDGSAPSRLTTFPADGRRIWDFDWSEGGKRLAVARASISTNIVMLRGLNTPTPKQ